MSLDPSYRETIEIFLNSPVETPVFLYNSAKARDTIRQFQNLQVKHGVRCHYAMKANYSRFFLRLILDAGLSIDVNSIGELTQALSCGFKPEQIIFAGVGKTDRELLAAVRAGIKTIKCESVEEIAVLGEITESSRLKARVGLRLNPEIDPGTHPYIATGLAESKFGIDKRDLAESLRLLKSFPNLECTTLDAHIGSQITDLNLFTDVFSFLYTKAEELNQQGIQIQTLDLGGGFGIEYDGSGTTTVTELGLVFENMQKLNLKGYDIAIEPGRSLVANCCLLMTQVLYTKRNGDKLFAVVDGSMTENIRPSLYGANHPIIKAGSSETANLIYDVVGPVCESGDFLGESIALPPVKRGDYLALLEAGAYTTAMASNYNMRPTAAEYWVENGKLTLTRRKQNINEWLTPLEVSDEI
ncbi:MAG: diaminopimelate decarboxylase [Bacteroidetes bacterium]|nr:diaminopimelate decarboxylase [Bacteroidota bacterium]